MSMEPTAEGAASAIAIALCNKRVLALEEQCRVLAAEVDRMRREHNEEVAEFSAGFDAGQQGLPESAEPNDVKYDVWKCGYAWGAYSELTARVVKMQPVVDAVIGHKRDLGFRFPVQVEAAIDAYEAGKE